MIDLKPQDKQTAAEVGKLSLPQLIPADECQITFARSGGPGGQNVNKVNTKVTLKWKLEASKSLGQEEKQILLEDTVIISRFNGNGEIVLHESSTRSQLENRTRALLKLNRMIQKALTPKKERRATRPSRASKENRLRLKQHRSKAKSGRSWTYKGEE